MTSLALAGLVLSEDAIAEYLVLLCLFDQFFATGAEGTGSGLYAPSAASLGVVNDLEEEAIAARLMASHIPWVVLNLGRFIAGSAVKFLLGQVYFLNDERGQLTGSFALLRCRSSHLVALAWAGL